jgi:DNA-binding NtrC family response regulator
VGSNDLIGSSAAMQYLRQYLPKVAASGANVLITGPTGTGKELVAECIHRLGPRRDGAFVSVNCAAIPEALFEGELFGYEAGAFTGALRRYEGKLRLASGGTLFLDEIGEMSPTGQAKILRAIEAREVMALGGRAAAAVDVRFVAATNQDLELLVKSRGFRPDLYYRLNVARLHLPPLTERKEDIPDLFAHFVGQFNDRLRGRVGLPTRQLLECLLQYDWPGNVREIRNLVEALFIDPPDGEITLGDLPPSFQHIFGRFSVDTMPERDRLISVLHETNWNKKQTAVVMNWSRMTLYRKLSKYHITAPQGDDEDGGSDSPTGGG